MERYRIDYEKYRERFEELYPDMSEEQRIEIFEMRIVFWLWLVENYDLLLSV